MENENEDIQSEDEIVDPPEVAEGDEDKTDWKALALKNQGIAKRLKTKLEKEEIKKEEIKQEEIKPEVKPDKPDKPTDFDYGQKAFLKSYGIDGADERELVKSFMNRTGDDLDTVINDDILQAKLKSLRDAKVAKEAVPANTGRSVTSHKLDYWLAKYQTSGNLAEVPKELQRDVLNARLKAEEQKKMFG